MQRARLHSGFCVQRGIGKLFDFFPVLPFLQANYQFASEQLVSLRFGPRCREASTIWPGPDEGTGLERWTEIERS